MQFIQLIYFTTTVKHNSITKAAEELYVTQPTISTSIKQLEQEFHTTLFVRNNNTLKLTDSGEFFYHEAKKLLSSIDALKSHMDDYLSGNKILKIGIPPMIGTFLFPKIFKEFSNLHKDIKLVTTEIGSIALIKALKNNEVNLAITSMNEILSDSDIQTFTILNTELVFCVNKNHPLSNETIISMNKIKDTPLVLLKADSYQHIVLNERFKKNNIIPNIILESNQLYTIKQLLSYNEAGAFMFKEIVDQDPDLIGIPIENPIKVDIALLWNTQNIQSQVATEFIEFVHSFKDGLH